MTGLNHNWSEILRILNDPNEDFVCSEHDPLEDQQASFRAQDEVQKIVRDPRLMAKVYMRGKQAAVPPGTPLNLPDDPWERSVEVRRRICKRILLETRRAQECEKKRRQREPLMLRLDLPVELQGGLVTLHAVVPAPKVEGEEESELPDLDRLFRPLSRRQRQVAELLCEGDRPSDIADRLKVSRPFISKIIRQLRQKYKGKKPQH